MPTGAGERFIKRMTSLGAYEICDDSGAVVATLKVRAAWGLPDISTDKGSYRMVGLDGRHVRDRRDRRRVFTLRKTFASIRHKKLVDSDGNSFYPRWPEKRPDPFQIMQVRDGQDALVLTVQRLLPIEPSRDFSCTEARLAPGVVLEGDAVLFVALAFQLFERNLPAGTIWWPFMHRRKSWLTEEG